MATGLRMVKKELGPDALILSTRTIRSGKLGLLGKPILEITAAVDADYQAESSSQNGNGDRRLESGYSDANNQLKNHSGKNEAHRSAASFHSVLDDPVDQYLHTEYAEQSQKRIPEDPGHKQPQDVNPQQNKELQNEVNELKDLVKNLAGQIAQFSDNGSRDEKRRTQELQAKDPGYQRNGSAAIHGDHLLSRLIEKGINVESSRTIAGFLRDSLTDQELSNSTLVDQTIVDTISNLIEVDTPLFGEGDEQSRIAFIGPTGVGKTTTLAKIAAAHLASRSNKIALITIDTYRIAAVEQLKVYGEIMHLPVEVVITPEQLRKALDLHRDKDLILIDTAGRSPRDKVCVEELGTFFTPELNIDKHLVLSATTRENELLQAIDRFRELDITHTIFTKIDECENLGVLLNIQIQNTSPLTYLTNGQRVPEDLLTLTPQFVAELIMDQKTGPLHDEHITSNS